jgi:hypothetical protein
MVGDVELITSREAIEFLLPKHYSGRKPQITKAFGWKIDSELVAVCTFGKPASPQLCTGICGKDHAHSVYELNRLCRVEHLEHPLSQFVGACLRILKEQNWIVVSYSDTGMNHNGYIYQACNFLYTGRTRERTDKWTEGNKHSRHYDNTQQGRFRKVRTAKNRYVYFCTRDKKLKKHWRLALNYPILPYPKEPNKNYVLGEYQKPILVEVV